MTAPLIFGIGLNKTGTISLHQALETLGIPSLHWGGPDVRAQVLRAVDEERPLVDDLGGYQAFSDIEDLSTRFATLDQQYPGSRFILTTRPVESWIESRRRHVLRNRQRAARGEYCGTFLSFEPEVWRQRFNEHHETVTTYFAGRGDLLTMRITEGDGFDVLCPFLGLPVPAEAFPWRHRAAAAD